MRELALFAGMGGGILGGKLLGWNTVCAVEINEYCRRVLMQRQDDGCLEPFPIWDDIQTFDGKPWAGCVDIVTGGFPCQDISAAGRGAGIDGERSGLWREMARVIGEVRPRFVLVENSPVLTVRGLGTVLGDLAARGYDAEWGVLGAADIGAPHKRDRIWIVADPTSKRPLSTAQVGIHCSQEGARPWHEQSERCGSTLSNPHGAGLAQRQGITGDDGSQQSPVVGNHRTFPDWPADPAEAPESGVGRVVDGCSARVDRLKALGNGQVPRVAAAAFAALSQRLTND